MASAIMLALKVIEKGINRNCPFPSIPPTKSAQAEPSILRTEQILKSIVTPYVDNVELTGGVFAVPSNCSAICFCSCNQAGRSKLDVSHFN
jgi:hypothetical protein